MKTISLKIASLATILLSLGAGISLVQAQISDQQLGLQYGSATGLSPTDPRIVAGNIVRAAMGFLGVIMVCVVLYSGFLWMTAGGNDEQIGTAKKWLSASTIGLVIILSAYSIASFVVNSAVDATNFSNPTVSITPPV